MVRGVTVTVDASYATCQLKRSTVVRLNAPAVSYIVNVETTHFAFCPAELRDPSLPTPVVYWADFLHFF
jgi:hypothetical protein